MANVNLERDTALVKRWRDFKTGPHCGLTFGDCLRNALTNFNDCGIGTIYSEFDFEEALDAVDAIPCPTTFGGWVLHGR